MWLSSVYFVCLYMHTVVYITGAHVLVMVFFVVPVGECAHLPHLCFTAFQTFFEVGGGGEGGLIRLRYVSPHK